MIDSDEQPSRPNKSTEPAAVTEGHLLELAKKDSMKLVTLDRGIPGALCVG